MTAPPAFDPREGTETMHDRYEPDIVECNDCGRQFDLNQQGYYGPVCPECRGSDEESDDGRA